MSSLVLGLASAASVSYLMFAITRTLTGMALAGFTIIVMPLGKARKEWVGPTVKGETEPIWPLLTVFLPPTPALAQNWSGWT